MFGVCDGRRVWVLVVVAATAGLLIVSLAAVSDATESWFQVGDVPARTSYVMAVVTPEERQAASSVTNVPRRLAGALPPIAAGWH